MKRPSGSQQVVRVRAEVLDDRGAGLVAHRRGHRTVRLHVAGLLPGEEADVRIEHLSPHRPDGWAQLLRRHGAAPERVVPVCSGYGRCGGCALQHLSYAAQLLWKQERLRGALAVAGLAPAVVSACFPSENEGLGQRSRAKLVAARAGARVVLGAYAPRSHDVVDLGGCRVVTPALRALTQATAAAATEVGLSCYDARTGRGQLRHVVLREVAGGDLQVSLVFADVPPEETLAQLVAALRAGGPALASVTLHENRRPGDVIFDAAAPERALFGPPALWDRLDLAGPSVALRVSARSFLQVNRPVAARLYRDVVAALAPAPGDSLLDLYCGVGGIGLGAARAVPGLRVLGIEESAVSVADAEASAAAAGLADRCRFLRGDAQAALAAVPEPPTLCVVNPPRRGCDDEVLARLCRLRPRALAYVSCDPDTLARDLRSLTAAGYALASAAPYDMHPHTPHVETLALLRAAAP